MQLYETTVKELAPLTPIEEVYKYIYVNNIAAADALTDPRIQIILDSNSSLRKQAIDILAAFLQKPQIEESNIFMPYTDIMVSRHPRYLPSISHSHDFFEIQYILKGTLHQTIDQKDADFHAGDFCFIAPHVNHAIKAFSDDIIVFNLLIKKHVFENAFSGLLGSDGLIAHFFNRALYSETFIPYLINHTKDDKNILNLILKLYNTSCLMNSYTPRLLKVQFEELFLYILRDHTEDFENSPNYKKEQQKMMSITAYIREHYDIVTLNNLADCFSYNSAYLSRLIKKYTGCSFSQLLQDIRFDKAIHMLHTTDNSIEEIIIKLGYSDRSFFYKEFKKKYGMSPAEYRKHTITH